MAKCPSRNEFFTLYAGLLKGLNLIQQKGWDPKELHNFFGDIKGLWLPYLESRHAFTPVELPQKALARLHDLLAHWPDPLEKTVLEARLATIVAYFAEANKPVCDQASLNFFLGDEGLAQLSPTTTTRPFSSSLQTLTSFEAKLHLEQELAELFPDQAVKVKLSDKTLARASTGKESIRLREDHEYTRAELEQLTAHEAWVHLGTNLQGAQQAELPWLGHWHPSVTLFQEGLAIIAEIVAGCWTERRQWEVIHRHQAGLMALRGWNAREVYQWLLDKGLHPPEAIAVVLRVFRGCSLEGGMAFGKEFLYVQGLKRWCELAPTLGRHDMLVALSGKMSFSEWELLRRNWSDKLLLPNAPEALLTWPEHFQIKGLRFTRISA